MKAVILAGRLGTRTSEETNLKPKPMIEVGGKFFLRHVLKIYPDHCIKDFVVFAGHMASVVKEYFPNYFPQYD